MTKHTQLKRYPKFSLSVRKSFGWRQAEKMSTHSGSKPYLKGFPVLVVIRKTEIALYDILSTNALFKIVSSNYTLFNMKH